MHKTRRAIITVATIASLATIAASSVEAQLQPPPELVSQARALALVCRADFTPHCSGVQPGGGRGLACLQQHLAELGPDCRNALPKAEALRSKAAATGALPR